MDKTQKSKVDNPRTLSKIREAFEKAACSYFNKFTERHESLNDAHRAESGSCFKRFISKREMKRPA